MHRYLAVAAAIVIAGCASTSQTTSTARKPMEEKESRTGSRIPVRDPVGTSAADGSAATEGAPTRTN